MIFCCHSYGKSSQFFSINSEIKLLSIVLALTKDKTIAMLYSNTLYTEIAKKEELNDEYTCPMKVGFCASCNMVQLVEQPERERMFHENYAFFSSTSMPSNLISPLLNIGFA